MWSGIYIEAADSGGDPRWHGIGGLAGQGRRRDGAAGNTARGFQASCLCVVTVCRLQEGCLHSLEAGEAAGKCHSETQIEVCEECFEGSRWVSDVGKPGVKKG